jgi:DNA repair photolyase
MLMAKRFGRIKTYEDWISPKIVKNALELLDVELPKLKNKIENIHLCFTTDPFMYNINEVTDMSLKIIKKINDFGIKCSILTKGILPIELSEFSNLNNYGITLISLDENFRNKMEPYSASYMARIESLRMLKEKGFDTWVSIEPYPTPNIIDQDMMKILEAVDFVDKIIFGKLNYNKMVSEYKNAKGFFNKMARTVVSFCKNRNIKYHIKNGTITRKVK